MSEATQDCEDAAGRPIEGWAAWWLRADPWPLLLLPLLLMIRSFWVYRSPTVAMVLHSYYDDFCCGIFLLGMLVAGRRFQLVVRNWYEAHYQVETSA